jgi:hypothetical protein
MTNDQQCPVCLNAYGATLSRRPASDDGDRKRYDCTVCGTFVVTRTALTDFFKPDAFEFRHWTPVRRAALSHRLRNSSFQRSEAHYPRLTSEIVEPFAQGREKLPSVVEQVSNIIRTVGEHERAEGEPLRAPSLDFYALVGSANPDAASRLVIELARRGLLTVTNTSTSDGTDFMDASLTLPGWERWDAEQRGKTSASYGVIAMPYGIAELDDFVEDVLKPTVETINPLRLIRVDDEPTAGVIDNIMRVKIRDAAFLLADLTHANNGAYWEAGFAEGLGKPVIYLCTESVWKERRTHFDTNHCTTLIWNIHGLEKFKRDLVATIRNSLRML